VAARDHKQLGGWVAVMEVQSGHALVVTAPHALAAEVRDEFQRAVKALTLVSVTSPVFASMTAAPIPVVGIERAVLNDRRICR
jgi:hypothetical protein